ncbi:MAG: sugar transferase [Planctomycetes bacterium]|jgi:lipopolysaccharide/colanic/teichoic acid biosynthesis glycosyltransferase|nr:sugar transferase [Phycisphaerae bacterium]NBB95374.1 sugar transferase [Planctomycetota bacterium]
MTRVISAADAPDLLSRLDDAGSESVAPAGGAAYLAVKRVLDIVLSVALLVLLSPVMLLTALLVKLSSRGPIIFSQTRAGTDGQPFTMYKFRTMRSGAQDDVDFLRHRNYQNGPVFKLPEDPRLTFVGKFLRRSSIDELPQLFNVLRGEMSLVGPRPLWLPEAQRTTGAARLRMKVTPGLTCLWQISGRSELTYEQWILLDLYYLRSRGLLLDLLIMVQTIPAVLCGHGAY